MKQRFSAPMGRVALALLKLVLVPFALGFVVLALLHQRPAMAVKFSPLWILLAVIAIEIALWIVSLRLSQLVAIYGRRFSPGRAFRTNIQATFYFLVVPTQAAMEAVRFLQIRSNSGATATEVTAVLLLDRIVGALSAALIGSAAAMFVLPQRIGAMLAGHDPTMVVAVLVGLVALLAAAAALARMLARRYSAVRDMLARLIVAPKRFASIFLLAIVAQVLVIASVACALEGLGIKIPLGTLAFAIMGGTVLMVIPVALAGIGPAEVGGIALLLAADVEEAPAIMAVFVTYLTRVFAGLQGAAIEVLSGRRTLADAFKGRNDDGFRAPS